MKFQISNNLKAPMTAEIVISGSHPKELVSGRTWLCMGGEESLGTPGEKSPPACPNFVARPSDLSLDFLQEQGFLVVRAAGEIGAAGGDFPAGAPGDKKARSAMPQVRDVARIHPAMPLALKR